MQAKGNRAGALKDKSPEGIDEPLHTGVELDIIRVASERYQHYQHFQHILDLCHFCLRIGEVVLTERVCNQQNHSLFHSRNSHKKSEEEYKA